MASAMARHAESIGMAEATGGTETSKYPEERKSTEIPVVAASEPGSAQTGARDEPAGAAAPVSWDVHEAGPRTPPRSHKPPA